MKTLVRKTKYLWKKSVSAKISMLILGTWILVGVMADFLAGSKPIVVKWNNELRFPIFEGYFHKLNIHNQLNHVNNWNKENYDWVINPLIPYGPLYIDYEYNHPNMPNTRHWFGTYANGKDLLSGLIHGARWSLLIGFFSASIAFVVGTGLGLISGYFGNNKLKISIPGFIVFSILFPLIGFECIEAFNWGTEIFRTSYFVNIGLAFMLITATLVLPVIITKKIMGLIHRKKSKKRTFYLPVDTFIQKIVELKIAIPYLLFVMAFSALFSQPSTFEVILIIGLSGWTGIARFVRAETLKTKAMGYIEAAIAGGLSKQKIIAKHVFPNAASPAWTAVSFVFAGAIIVEGLLSFLGLIPHGKPSWGQILADSKNTPSHYLPAILPGIAILAVLLSVQTLTEKFKKGNIAEDYRNTF